MQKPDFSQVQALLGSTHEEVLETAARLLGQVFNSSTLCPPAEALSRRLEIAAAVRTLFPMRFVDTYENWVDQDESFARALAAGDDTQIAQCYRTAFDAMWQNWLRIVHFFPFILMVSINRLNREAIKQHAAEKLGKAIYHYEVFYRPAASEEKRESDQRELLFALLDLFRKLADDDLLGEEFFLHPVLRNRAFIDLFPRRFDAQILMFQQIRNLNTHRHLGTRRGSFLAAVYELLVWSFLDIVSLLQPICEAFILVYVTNVIVEASRVTALGISLSGVPGPSSVRYLLPQGYLPDVNKLHYGQLYIVARGKELSDAAPASSETSSAEPLQPRDYLDLTPFLIFESQHPHQEPARQPEEQRHLFLLNEYEERNRFLQFLEFAGAFDRTIPEGARRGRKLSADAAVDPGEQLDANRLIDEIRSFKDAVARLGAKSQIGGYASDRTLEPAFVLKKFWDISRVHLASALPVEQFTEEGVSIADATPAIKTAYVPELFVAPLEAADVDTFFNGNKRGLVLVGPSGVGKSSLMAYAFLERLRARDICLFFTGRLIPDSAISVTLQKDCFARLADKEMTFSDFDAFLRRNDRTFTLFVDAVNEFSQSGGAITLLENLINFVKDDNRFKRCRVVVSVRAETWSQFCEHFGTERPLDTSYFHSQSGDAVHLGSFETEERRRRLFGKYQQYFRLRPAVYDRLSRSVRDLVRHPFMMSLVAESYSNLPQPGQPESQRVIPADLNYFQLFQSLTNRKATDASRLLRADDERSRMVPDLLKSCLYCFAQLVYARLTDAPGIPRQVFAIAVMDVPSSAPQAADAIPYDLVFKFEALQPFHAPVSSSSSLSAFGIALQLGLIERTFIPEIDELGQETQGRAFKFFHDRYTQLWLSAVYNREVLGPTSTAALARADVLAALAGKISDLIQRSVNAPVLAGAVDHWYHSNLRRAPSQHPDFLFPLLNALAVNNAGACRHYVCSLLSGLIIRDIVPASQLYAAVFDKGNRGLRAALADGFNEFWPDLPPSALGSLLETADKEKDDFVFARLADVFSFHFADFPDETLSYLSQAVMPAARYRDLAGVVVQAGRFEKHLTFTLFFTLTAIRSQSESASHLRKIHDFVYSNYRLLIESLVGDYGPTNPKNLVRSQVYGRIQDTAREIWETLGATQNGNNECFVEHNGLCQRDVIYEFFPYAVAMHNGDFETFSLEPGKPLRDLAIRMLTFEVTSIVGYKATVLLPFALCRDWNAAESFILDVLAVDNRSARFFGILLLVNISYTDPSLSERCLELLQQKILPGILAKEQEADWVILHAMGIVDNDVPGLWPRCQAILRAIFDHFTARGDEAAITRFGDDLLKANFFHDIRLGTRLVELMVSLGYLENALWRQCTFKVFGGLMARNPAALGQVLRECGVAESVVREARSYLTEEIVFIRGIHTNQVSWNRFFGNVVLHDVVLRCLTIKCIIGGFAQSNSTLEFAKEFRRFLVSAVKAYYGNQREESSYATIDVAAALAECENRRKVGEGEVHLSSRPRASWT